MQKHNDHIYPKGTFVIHNFILNTQSINRVIFDRATTRVLKLNSLNVTPKQKIFHNHIPAYAILYISYPQSTEIRHRYR